jgi:hypothetical protein
MLLSPAQLLWLRLVNADTPSGGHCASMLQPTLRALERRGLVLAGPDRRRCAQPLTRAWTITEAGGAWLKANP